MITKTTGFATCLVVLFLLTSCARPPSDEAVARERGIASEPEIEVAARDSRLVKTKVSSWSARPTTLKSQRALHAIHFINSKQGWVGGAEGQLYKTDDAGQSWRLLNLEKTRDTDIQSIFFLNDLMGWVVLQRDAREAEDPLANYFHLLRTTDGGETWQLQYEGKGLSVTRLTFTDPRKGWLTGFDFRRTPVDNYMVLHTADQGEHWEDASVELKRMLAERPQLNEGVVGIAFKEPGTTTVITNDLRMFQTSDNGKKWTPAGSIQNKFGLFSMVSNFGVWKANTFGASAAAVAGSAAPEDYSSYNRPNDHG